MIRRPHVLLAGESIADLVPLVALGAGCWSHDIVESSRPIEHLLALPPTSPDAAVVALSGRENVADLGSLIGSFPTARFVLLYPEFPPPAALARTVRRHGGVILRRTEAPAVIVATLVALLAGSAARTVQR